MESPEGGKLAAAPDFEGFAGERADASLCCSHLPDMETNLIYLFIFYFFVVVVVVVVQTSSGCCFSDLSRASASGVAAPRNSRLFFLQKSGERGGGNTIRLWRRNCVRQHVDTQLCGDKCFRHIGS